MSFLLPCPICGPRDVYEFRYGGEAQKRPEPGSSGETWTAYLYERNNVAGVERAWWFHRMGCRRWFQAERDTRDNRVVRAWLPEAATGSVADESEDVR
ncbi:MAG: sarcosine oxidase subunit delta [Chloroflexi bacterium]|nr:sarcosine oxidase subunit delta [Chloroflexota bacterium]